MRNLLQSLSDNIIIDTDKCTGCGICVDTCVLDNLRLLLPPCRNACPLHVNCQGYMKLIAQGDNEKALELVRETLPFAGILGRICSQPCELACHRGASGNGDALSIRALKRYLTEDIATAQISVPDRAVDSGHRVAIVGSGPAGMLAAYDLRVHGHEVVVLEAEAEPGGMLRWAIPEFRLPLPVLQAALNLLREMGVVFECGVKIGVDRSLQDLKSGFDAVIVATGCSRWAKLDMPGEDLSGVLHGLPFLHDTRAGETPEVGGRVIVIGGGNVAVDAAQTALRLGAEEVTIACLESERELPAFPWAVETALFEQITFAHGWGPTEFLSDDGAVSGVVFRRCVRVYDDDGSFNPLFLNEDLQTMPADTVIVAIGQARDTSLFSGSGLFPDGCPRADRLTLQTDDEKVFLAGDLLSGPSSAVDAMAQGREAAESVDRFLRGDHLRYGRKYAGPVITDFEIDIHPDLESDRVALPLRRYGGRGDFLEIEEGLGRDDARREAQRCNSCGQPVGFYRTCWFCLPCEVECPVEALHVEVPYLLR